MAPSSAATPGEPGTTELVLRLRRDQHQRLLHAAHERGLSLDDLIDEMITLGLFEFDTQARFGCLPAREAPPGAAP